MKLQQQFDFDAASKHAQNKLVIAKVAHNLSIVEQALTADIVEQFHDLPIQTQARFLDAVNELTDRVGSIGRDY